MRRVDLLATSSLLLGGCMRIYPDSELPDVKAEWYEDDCRPGAGSITIALIGIDSESRIDVTVPCPDLSATLVDLARERFRFEAVLRDDSGEIFSRFDYELDLRDGIDERVDLYFGAFSNFRVAWTFDMGATCESLGATGMTLAFSYPDLSPAFQSFAACEQTPFLGQFPDGTYTLRLRAVNGATVLASSPESDELEILDPELTDLGTIILSPL